MANWFGLHDAPSGIQDMNTFTRLKKTGLIRIPWHYPCPNLMGMIRNTPSLYLNGEFKRLNKRNKQDLTEIIKQSIKRSFSSLEEQVEIEKIMNHLRQWWMAVRMKKGDYIYIRGKRSDTSGNRRILKRGFIVQVEDNNIYDIPSSIFDPELDITSRWTSQQVRKVKIIKEVSDQFYNTFPYWLTSIKRFKKEDDIKLLINEMEMI